jgi:hypothetical protein
MNLTGAINQRKRELKIGKILLWIVAGLAGAGLLTVAYVFVTTFLKYY